MEIINGILNATDPGFLYQLGFNTMYDDVGWFFPNIKTISYTTLKSTEPYPQVENLLQIDTKVLLSIPGFIFLKKDSGTSVPKKFPVRSKAK